ncbi:Gamma-glutamyl-L-1-hydroxyisopropylamide hydrolase [Methylorubrum aminovorans]|uniref:Gamma-glutamyl-L-1-hydroxyisopropylamide hydrolase n=1 Tax=Methylorubrum aminovorans TaxID=269069 RepID=A0ABQ4UJ32_9HYPH|nr:MULTISPECIES: type 1 glutamine amidotransferase [Methylobacteriaceae]QIJ75956.1 type 1 glutamine amidotransferase [Methylobacterium sp. CLZ]QIJ80858.1 type 1 glutamine amidotransferase [Methylobacterium sp. NI91]GJE66532.1 Gamma-glutamyl-L-1-hydroxyisopropylamide hydrolase [Methylorubrum aminovorans]
MTKPMLRLLIADGNDRDGRAKRAEAVGQTTSQAFAAVVADLAPEAACTLLNPADAETVCGADFEGFDGMVLTGSTLRLAEDGPAVRRQLDLMRAALEAGLPVFGSCWGMQVAAAVAGGDVGANPRGPEYGFARRIARPEEAAAHPLLAGRGPAWDAPAIHLDAVIGAPPGARVLAANAVLDVQAIEIRYGGGLFWGTQYHPETDLDELAAMLRLSAENVVAAGLAADHAAVEAYAQEVADLADDDGPARRRRAWRLGIGTDVLESGQRRREIGNFLKALSTARGLEWPERDRVAR